MNLIFEMAIEKAAKEAMHKYLYNDSEGTSGGGYNDSAVLNVVAVSYTHLTLPTNREV